MEPQRLEAVARFHHGIAAEAKRLAERAAQFDARLVTTEKDWVRLPPDWRGRVTAWPVRAAFEDEAALDALLRRAVRGPDA